MKKILIADDSEDIRNLLVMALKNDYEVETVADGMIAFNKISLNPYDLLITDYEMPGLNGLELVQSTLTIHPDLPIVILTGNEEALPLLRESGARACFKKPLDFARLKLSIKNLLI
ncbi:MAG: response regulator [Desulfobacteraceae bacterium]|nr:MAG: response regulator [Desulfobacteraceae bacterium]